MVETLNGSGFYTGFPAQVTAHSLVAEGPLRCTAPYLLLPRVELLLCIATSSISPLRLQAVNSLLPQCCVSLGSILVVFVVLLGGGGSVLFGFFCCGVSHVYLMFNHPARRSQWPGIVGSHAAL